MTISQFNINPQIEKRAKAYPDRNLGLEGPPGAPDDQTEDGKQHNEAE